MASERPNWSMYTPAGDRAVQDTFDGLKTWLQETVLKLQRSNDTLKKIPGFTDTAVREAVGNGLVNLLYESVEDFGEAFMIDGKEFQKFFVRQCVDKQGGFAAMLQEYHGVR